ncbi:hypothetical protein XVE_3223 [Xanthomonas vesicatoria ATCC 35937]|uniref:Uncharacterized protein n=1 Tax=Xanthomonas vesicatoria ATCC 35937 TaxID=925775 RepID=F0BG59_9XANT|nr:hypothetical protein XVE_3223 [Xanthomonas vesicatoria ATCC 35937]
MSLSMRCMQYASMLMITAVKACCCERENEDGCKLAVGCEGMARFIGECP